MGIVKKFNIVLTSIFVLNFFISVSIIYRTEFSRARSEVLAQAELMITTALAAREYTAKEVWPILEEINEKSEDTFLPQSAPAYSATQIFSIVKKTYKDYSYREVVVNPRNLNHMPTEWETEIILHYKDNPDTNKMITQREKKDEEFLYISYPIKIEEKECLRCHTDAKTTPKGIVKKYGGVNGMGWKLNEPMGAVFVSVPMSLPQQKAKASLFNMLISLISIFSFIFIAIDFMLIKWVVEPISKISYITEQISLKKCNIEDFPKIKDKEIENLIVSIKRMRESLKKALQRMRTN